MQLRETGFSFGGKHSLHDFGLQYSESNASHPLIPEVEHHLYEIAGSEERVQFDGGTRQPLTFAGTLYVRDEFESQLAAQRHMRTVQAWLSAGQQRLIFDYEPDVYYLARLTKSSVWSLKNWFGGELSVAFEAEPCAYAVRETVWAADMTESAVTFDCLMVTGRPAPVNVTLRNTGDAVITGVAIGDGIVFEGLELAAGQTLTVRSERPIGASADGVNALPACAAFKPLELMSGHNEITVELDHGAGTLGCAVELRARGRW